MSALHNNAQNLEYPALYKSLDLPEYANATITGLGRQSANLHDGLKIFLESTDDYSALRAYYESELSDKGWVMEETIATRKMREAGMLDRMPFGGIFIKDNMKYLITTFRLKGISKITISVIE